MPQVNMLTIDLAQTTESQSVSMKSSGNEQEQVSIFSDVMAKHQEQKSGKDSQESGNTDCHHSTADEKVKKDESSEVESSQVENENVEDKVAVSQSENKQEEKQIIESQNNEATSEDNKIEGVIAQNSNDIAKKLLSFILASDEVSTQHVETSSKSEPHSDANVVAINTQTIDKLGKVSNPEKLSKEVESVTQIKSNEVLETKLDKSTNTALEKEKSDEVELSIKNQQSVSLKSEEEVISDLTLKSDLKQSITAQSIKEALLQKNNVEQNGVESNKSKVDIKNLESSNDLLAETGQKIITDDFSKEVTPKTDVNNVNDPDKIAQESKQTIKLDPQPLSVESMSANDAKVVELKSEELKSTIKVEQASERPVNQATIVNRSQSEYNQQGQQQGQQSQDNNQSFTKSEVEITKENQQVLTNTEKELAFNEKLTTNVVEKSNLQTILNDATATKILSQQSLNHAEEQSIQNNITKANADSISVQSAKSAINIQAETVSIYRKDFSNAVKEKVMVMINQKIKQLEIRLDPPELGSMHIKLNLQNEQAAVNFVVQNQQAKEALEQNMSKLKDMLADSGVDVGDANVEQRSQQSKDESEFSQRQGDNLDEISNDVITGEMAMSGENLYKASASGVDYYA